MPSHIEELLALVALELAALAFTTVAFIVVQPYAVEWRWASVLLPLVLLLQEHITRHAADTIPTHRATRALATVSSVRRPPRLSGGAGVGCRAGRRGGTAWKLCSQPATNDGWMGPLSEVAAPRV
jgi:hypothetical protein